MMTNTASSVSARTPWISKCAVSFPATLSAWPSARPSGTLRPASEISLHSDFPSSEDRKIPVSGKLFSCPRRRIPFPGISVRVRKDCFPSFRRLSARRFCSPVPRTARKPVYPGRKPSRKKYTRALRISCRPDSFFV